MFLSEISSQETLSSIAMVEKWDRSPLENCITRIRDNKAERDPYRFIKQALSSLKSPVYFGLDETRAENWDGHYQTFDLDRPGVSFDAAKRYVNKPYGVRVFQSHWNQGIFLFVVHSQDAYPATVFKFEVGGVQETKTKQESYNRFVLTAWPEVHTAAKRLLNNSASEGLRAVTIDHRRWKKLIQNVVQYHANRPGLIAQYQKDNHIQEDRR